MIKERKVRYRGIWYLTWVGLSPSRTHVKEKWEGKVKGPREKETKGQLIENFNAFVMEYLL